MSHSLIVFKVFKVLADWFQMRGAHPPLIQVGTKTKREGRHNTFDLSIKSCLKVKWKSLPGAEFSPCFDWSKVDGVEQILVSLTREKWKM